MKAKRNWQPALKDGLLGGKATEQVRKFLLEEIPPFRATTDARAWKAQSRKLRERTLKEVFLRGYSPKVVAAKPKVVWGETIRVCPEYVIRKLRYEVVPGYWMVALLYEPTALKGKAPVMLGTVGHHAGGKAADYNQIRCANLARRGVISLNVEFIGMGEMVADMYHSDIAMLDLVGMAGVGMFYLALKKGLDVLLAHPHADKTRVGCSGVSGGALQTIWISALDERVTLCAPVAGYTSVRDVISRNAATVRLNDVGHYEQSPVDMLSVLDYQEMTALFAPRPILVTLNEKDDQCFQTPHTMPDFEAIRPVYKAFGAEDKFQLYNNVYPGTHNYDADNRARFYRFLMEQWGIPGPAKDTHRQSEVLPETRLLVGLPVDQETVQSLTVRRARELVRKHPMPKTAAAREKLRRRVEKVLRLPEYASIAAKAPKDFASRGGIVTAGGWQIPVSVSQNKSAKTKSINLFLCQSGRKNFSAVLEMQQEPAAWEFAPDVMGLGENDYGGQWSMLLESQGHRVLGHQVAQVLACARAAIRATGVSRVRLVSDGALAGVVALCAAAMEPELFELLTSYHHLTTLTFLAETHAHCGEMPSLNCFGLLEVADLPQLTALMKNVTYIQPWRLVHDTKPGR